MFALLCIWFCIGSIIGGVVQLLYYSDCFDEQLTYGAAFCFVKEFYETYSDELNCIGLIIASAFIFILLLPGSILIICLTTLKYILLAMWKTFKFIFRKRVSKMED